MKDSANPNTYETIQPVIESRSNAMNFRSHRMRKLSPNRVRVFLADPMSIISPRHTPHATPQNRSS